MKPRTEEEFYAYMRGDFQMTVQEASDFWYGVDKSIKDDALGKKPGRTFGYDYPGVDLIKGSGYGQIER